MSDAIVGALIGVGGVLVGTLLASGIELVKYRLSSRKQATYLAARIICILDQFIDSCVEVVAERGEEDENGMLCYSPLPHSPSFPEDLDWKSINGMLMYDILSFPNKVNLSKGAIDDYEEANGPPCDGLWAERQFEFSVLGLMAINIKERLSGKYRIPADSVERRLDPKSRLLAGKREVEVWRAERQSAHEKMWRESPPPRPSAM